MRRRVVVPQVMHFSYLNLLEPRLKFLRHIIGWVGLKQNSSIFVTIEYLALKSPAKNTAVKKITRVGEIQMSIINFSAEHQD